MRKLIITAAAAALVCLAVPAVAMPAKAATVSDSELVLAKHHGGHGWRGHKRGRHYGWHRDRGHHYGWHRGHHRRYH